MVRWRCQRSVSMSVLLSRTTGEDLPDPLALPRPGSRCADFSDPRASGFGGILGSRADVRALGFAADLSDPRALGFVQAEAWALSRAADPRDLGFVQAASICFCSSSFKGPNFLRWRFGRTIMADSTPSKFANNWAENMPSKRPGLRSRPGGESNSVMLKKNVPDSML